MEEALGRRRDGVRWRRRWRGLLSKKKKKKPGIWALFCLPKCPSPAVWGGVIWRLDKRFCVWLLVWFSKLTDWEKWVGKFREEHSTLSTNTALVSLNEVPNPQQEFMGPFGFGNPACCPREAGPKWHSVQVCVSKPIKSVHECLISKLTEAVSLSALIPWCITVIAGMGCF